VTSITHAGAQSGDTMSDEVACKLSRPSGGHSGPRIRERAETRPRHGAAAGPNGPTGRRQRLQTTGAGRRCPRRENEVLHMATMTKLRKKIERVSALNGWRMRWHMQ